MAPSLSEPPRDSAVDLRSDTVTRPTPAMRRAMAEAEVGDDVYGEDPTLNRLEAEAARHTGQEAALFVPSGTMGNQIALHLLGRPGDEVICDAGAHIVHYELGAMAALSGLLPKAVASVDGHLEPEAVAAAIAPGDSHRARTGIIALENTANMAGGTVCSLERLDALLEVARERGVPIHLDGARVFNAAAALGVPVSRLTASFDTVSFCLSKGLGAPVGSLFCSSAERVTQGRRIRKMFGGAMRQAGVLAAAGLIALEEGPGRLAEDHAHARLLADTLAELPGIELDPERVATNIVIVESRDPARDLVDRLRDHGVLAVVVGPHRIRFTTHRDVDRPAIDAARERLRECLG